MEVVYIDKQTKQNKQTKKIIYLILYSSIPHQQIPGSTIIDPLEKNLGAATAFSSLLSSNKHWFCMIKSVETYIYIR